MRKARAAGAIWAALGAALLGSTTLTGPGAVTAAPSSAPESAASAQSTAVLPLTDPAALVDPLIGTADQGDDFPGADVPFGMVQWSPDTMSRPAGGGYSYSDSSITGFSLTHLSGAGCTTAGDVPVLPTVGTVNPAANDLFSHSREYATAGYYKVSLHNNVTVQLTATARTGMARFGFPSTARANLIFKLADSQNGDSATSFTMVSDANGDYQVAGSATSGDFCGGTTRYTVYFDMRFSQPFSAWGSYTQDSMQPGPAGTATAPGPKTAPNSYATPPAVPAELPKQPDAPVYYLPLSASEGSAEPASGPEGGYVTFRTNSKRPLLAKVGLSYVSAANAGANLTTENAGWDFAATQSAAVGAWNALLGKIRVSGGTDAQRKVFYTALYHSLQYPSVFSDDNRQYRGMDGKVHTVDHGHSAFYTNVSGWDIYRSQAPLEALLDPSAASDTAQSMVDDYRQTGQLPKWPAYNGESYVMVGDPADALLADYYAFGATGFDAKTALADMISQATRVSTVRPGGHYVSAPGYLPVDGRFRCCNFYGPVSTSLEYDTDDFAISALAGTLGDGRDQQSFADLAQGWRSVLDPASGFAQPRDADGIFPDGFTPASPDGFVEGDSWIYSGMVPFDLAGLTAAKGGKAAMAAYLNSVLSSFQGADGYASLDNEPSIELPWEYDYIGEPDKTQQAVRQIQDQFWTPTPGGTAEGNDDLGALSAWYVWSALGMYPMTPGTAELAIGSPLFARAVVTLPSGGELTVVGNGAASGAPYVQSAAWDGRSWGNAYAPPTAISRGGTLSFRLGAKPNPAWASMPAQAPPSYGGDVVDPPAPRTGSVVSAVSAELCLDVSYSSATASNPVQLAACDATASQQWTFALDGTVRSVGMCLSAGNGTVADGGLATLSGCDGSVGQQWTVGPDGSLINPHSGLCLDDPRSSTMPGTGLLLMPCNTVGTQGWRLPPAAAPRVGVLTSDLTSGLCVSGHAASTGGDPPVVTSVCDNASDQDWVVEPDGTFRLAGQCLGVPGGSVPGGSVPGGSVPGGSAASAAAGALVGLSRCDGTGTQQWTQTTSGELINPASGLCLTQPRYARGQARQLRLGSCDGSPSQTWQLPT
jgi:predicted alpha-1,2-mannosidase